MKWATRNGIHVDRAASAWLISSYVDAAAEFIYVDHIDDVPADATAFDMVGGDLTHHGDDVTFETSFAVTTSSIPCCGASARSSTRQTCKTTASTPRRPPASTQSSGP
ncbi:MAG: hypothetical protein ACI91O_001408 [Candidatus Poriferisodalaceae bacterium]|jgi:hypothetical protein